MGGDSDTDKSLGSTVDGDETLRSDLVLPAVSEEVLDSELGELEAHSRDDLAKADVLSTPEALLQKVAEQSSIPAAKLTGIPLIDKPMLAKLTIDGPPKPALKPSALGGRGPALGLSSSKAVSKPTRISPLARSALSAQHEPETAFKPATNDSAVKQLAPGTTASTTEAGLDGVVQETPSGTELGVADGELPVSSVDDEESSDVRPVSPTPSEGEEEFPGQEEQGMIVHLRGEVPITGVSGLPSFNYKYLNRNVGPSVF